MRTTRTTVRWDDAGQRFQIVEIEDTDDGGFTIASVIREFPDGTTNAEACKEFDLWTAKHG